MRYKAQRFHHRFGLRLSIDQILTLYLLNLGCLCLPKLKFEILGRTMIYDFPVLNNFTKHIMSKNFERTISGVTPGVYLTCFVIFELVLHPPRDLVIVIHKCEVKIYC